MVRGMLLGYAACAANPTYEWMTLRDDRGASDQKDAEGFIKLNALRLRTLAMSTRKG